MEFDDTELEILDACVWCGGEDLADWGTPVRGFESVVCGSCRVIFIRNHLNAKGLKKYYRNYMSEQHQADQELNRQRDRMYLLEYEFVRRFVGAGKVLDVGCGNGLFLDLFAADGYHCHGVEFGAEAAQAAGRRHNVRYGEFPRLDFHESFDLIVFRGVIEHVPEPRAYLEKAASLLGPGGAIYITSTPNADSICCDLFKQRWNQHFPEAHIVHFRPKHFDDFFAPLGIGRVAEHFFYEETPYADPPEDVVRVAEAVAAQRAGHDIDFDSPAFWGTMMTLLYRRRESQGR